MSRHGSQLLRNFSSRRIGAGRLSQAGVAANALVARLAGGGANATAAISCKRQLLSAPAASQAATACSASGLLVGPAGGMSPPIQLKRDWPRRPIGELAGVAGVICRTFTSESYATGALFKGTTRPLPSWQPAQWPEVPGPKYAA